MTTRGSAVQQWVQVVDELGCEACSDSSLRAGDEFFWSCRPEGSCQMVPATDKEWMNPWD